MRGLEDPVPGHIVDVRPGCDPDTAHLGGDGVRKVVAVQVGGSNDVEILGPGQDLLQRDVRDVVLDQDLVARLPPHSSQLTATSANSSRATS